MMGKMGKMGKRANRLSPLITSASVMLAFAALSARRARARTLPLARALRLVGARRALDTSFPQSLGLGLLGDPTPSLATLDPLSHPLRQLPDSNSRLFLH